MLNVLHREGTHFVSRCRDLGYFISINIDPLNVLTPFIMIGTAKGR